MILEGVFVRTLVKAEESVLPGQVLELHSPIQAQIWQPAARASWHQILFASIRQDESAETKDIYFVVAVVLTSHHACGALAAAHAMNCGSQKCCQYQPDAGPFRLCM